MRKTIIRLIADRIAQKRMREEQEAIEAWSLQVGREAAQLWVQALSARDAGRLSNA